jgi:uncharacterized protein (DUF2252 family)
MKAHALAAESAIVPGPRKIEHPTREQRVARGKAARTIVPRSRHAELDVVARPDALTLIEEEVRDRVAELVAIRYGRMAQSPYAFYRGSAVVMASDLSRTPTSGLQAQLGGDAHLANFGMFGTPERNLAFDATDFDETLPGPWEWDVKRLAASFEIAGRLDAFSAADRREIVHELVRAYRTAMTEFAAQSNLEVWYARMDIDSAKAAYDRHLSGRQLRRKNKAVAKARTRSSEQAFARLTRLVGGERRIASNPPLLVTLDALYATAARRRVQEVVWNMFRAYRASLPNDRRVLLEQYRLVELAHRVVGVGSVGTRCWIALLLGVDNNDPLILQIKQAQASVLERHLGRSRYPNHGQRVVAGQRLMQSASDIFLGWGRAAGIDRVPRDYYFRQLRDWKGSFVVEEMIPAGMRVYAGICGWTLARAHARSGDRVAIAAYLGKADAFDVAVAAFARTYADVTERDHAALVRAVRTGRIRATTGV